MKEPITTLRQKIQDIDRELVRLIRLRIQTVLEIGEVKRIHDLPIRDPDRENEVLAYIRNTPHDPINTKALESIFKTIMRISSEAQKQASSK